WFKEVLNINTLELKDENSIILLSKYSINLAIQLFQACQIPMFKDIEINSLNMDKIQKNKFTLSISYEYIDFIPIQYYIQILDNSF
ncbi:hypothetical protein, partial [Aliarcobacter butzleri]